MASIQNTFSFENTSGQEELGNINIEVVFPKFSFRFLDDEIQRFVKKHQTFSISHQLSDDNYSVSMPLPRLVGSDAKDIYGFFLYHFIEILNSRRNVNSFSFPFSVYVKDNNGQQIMSETFEGIYYQKKSHSSDYDEPNFDQELSAFKNTYGPLDDLNTIGLDNLPKEKDSQVFIINKEAFELLKFILSSGNREGNTITDRFVLEFIQIITDISDGHPKLITNENYINVGQLSDFFRDRDYQFSTEMWDYTLANFQMLFDFPLRIPEIQKININGTLEIVSEDELSLQDLDFYDLSVEYSQKNNVPKILRYLWSSADNRVENKVDFVFDDDNAILKNNISGHISVKVKGYDGAVLWEEHYDKSDEKLQNIEISINKYPGGDIVIDSSTGNPKSSKRLRGKVLQQSDKYNLNELTIVLQAKNDGDSLFKIVSATKTDSSGNFSMDYPYGDYSEAQALVSLMPNSPADIQIHSDRTNQTISDDFIYLLLTDKDVVIEDSDGGENAHDDCGCHEQKKAKRLPDQEDLIESDEYTQDMGGGCLNLSTPNRTLKEYNYNAVVRISDPDVSNYILQKNLYDDKVTYDLVGGSEKLTRGIVDLDNPIRWEDAPDAKDNLSIYQAVTVATGHILHFKSIFKADGYSLGDLVYSLPLAPGQKKQIVVFESSHSLTGAETQSISQGESLSADLISDRLITDQLSGGINENLSGRSKAHTSGMSAGLGASGSYGGIGASLGVAGGFSNSNSSASQNSSRNVSQFFGEKLRQSLMQNAESYRQLNASVVTTVTEGQDYGVTSEVVANHNHCHSLTMMYFEVLRHYAIFQEISHVEECVFVPLLLTNFSTENIHKWKDILAENLLPIPSNTYLKWQGYSGRRNRSFRRQHPLLRAFDANERINDNYERVNFPEDGESYADTDVMQVKGKLQMKVNIPRPKTKYDRIKSFPIVTETVTSEELNVEGTIRRNIGASILVGVLGPIGALFGGSERDEVHHDILVAGKIYDAFMTMDDNYRAVPPSRCIRIKTFSPQSIHYNGRTLVFAAKEFFEDGHVDKLLWESYAKILGYTGEQAAAEMMNYYLAGRLISEWDDIFYKDILPLVFARTVDSIKIHYGNVTVEETTTPGDETRYRISHTGAGLPLDFSTDGKYVGGHRTMSVNFNSNGPISKTRKEIGGASDYMSMSCDNPDVQALKNHIKLNIGRVDMAYSTEFYNGKIFRGYVNDDLLDGTNLYIPLTSRDKKEPRKEDSYLVNNLIEHLNSNIEYYNKILWTNLDTDRRYMLLDGFNIQTYTSTGHKSVMRSLASVVKNELITIAGNSLVMPVADGYKIGRNSMLEEIDDDVFVETSLLDYYKPLTPMKPYRLSTPTRGVFMEAIQGSCDACEMVKENSSQDWDKFRTEEPTPISPVVTPTPTITNYKPEYKDFAQPLVNIQNAPDAPAPGVGLSQLSELLGKAGAFNDITGLAGNQDNVIRTYLSNQENAKAFAEMSKSLATQQHNTSNTDSISDGIGRARNAGTISDEDAQNLTRQHLQQQIDGGESSRENAQFEREQNRPSLSEVAANAVNRGQAVQAERTDADGTNEQIHVSGQEGNSLINEEVRNIQALRQPSSMSCWATAATIMINWKNRTSSTIETVLRSAGNNLEPANEDFYVTIFNDNTGLFSSQKEQFIGTLGMIGQAPASYPLSQYVEWLHNYGPLWITTDASADAQFSPHARILIRIVGDSNDLDNVIFTFINPSSGIEETESFPQFISSFEQMATDIGADNDLFIQIVHFRDLIQRESTEGQSLTRRTWMSGVPNMVRFKERLVRFAIDEYNDWHNAGTHTPGSVFWEIDDVDFVKDRLRDYWMASYRTDSRGIATDRLTSTRANNNIRNRSPWSAAFISYLVTKAGIADNNVFTHSIKHVDFIAHSILHTLDQWSNPFWGMRVENYRPEIGDIVCRAKLNSGASRQIHTYDNIVEISNGEVTSFPSHTDIVVNINRAERYMDVIGGNLELSSVETSRATGDWVNTIPYGNDTDNVSVGKRRIYLTSDLKIDPSGKWEIYNNDTGAGQFNSRVQFTGPQLEYFAIIRIRTDARRP